MGLPLLNGFIGEFMILQGTFASPHAGWRYAAFAVSGIVLGAAYLLWLYQRLMFGKIDKPENEKLRDVSFREQATLLPIVALCVWIGVYPKPFLDPLRVPVRGIVERIEPARFAEKEVVRPAAETAQKSAAGDN
jgi:NADH-quinone oxidoreductase subunit M